LHCKKREGALCALDFSFIACTLRRAKIEIIACTLSQREGECGCMLALLTKRKDAPREVKETSGRGDRTLGPG
jgi:hypothetical protein